MCRLPPSPRPGPDAVRSSDVLWVVCRSFAQCGIHVWMLTGDKLETAISIGMSTKLLTPELNIMIVQEHDAEVLGRQLQKLIEYVATP